MELEIYETQGAMTTAEMEEEETSYQIILGMFILTMMGLFVHELLSCIGNYSSMKAELRVFEYMHKENTRKIEELEEQIETLKEENAKLTDDLNTLKTIKMDELIEKVASLDNST